MFSTRAEYGVRVMAHLAANGGDGPVALAAIAEAEGLPLAYLEHLVRRLRQAGLVTSRRGARGGYALARPADAIAMSEVVSALEGAIAPIECITAGAGAGEDPVCAREAATDRACPTKLLWTRVQGAIVGTLEGISLADLVRPTATENGTRQRKRTAA
ncbi:MAG TPA: Rrf2 family transcriptional regulator [Thermoleophilaceae bacterium]|nr:Rrf2 family transcriptional regulator [Thermoleophilaceae bacterium]